MEQGLRLKTREYDGSNNNLVVQAASHPKGGRTEKEESTWGCHREHVGVTRLLCSLPAPPKSQLKGKGGCLTLEAVPGLEAPGGLATRCCSRSRRGGTGGRAACGATENGEGGRST